MRIILSTGFGLEIARMEFVRGTSGCTYVYGLISLIYTVAYRMYRVEGISLGISQRLR